MKLFRQRMNRLTESGGLLVEAMISLGVFTVGVLGVVASSQVNTRSTRQTLTEDLVSNAFVNTIEVLDRSDFNELYQQYHDRSFDVNGNLVGGGQPPPPMPEAEGNIAELLDPAGDPALVSVNFVVDEHNLAPEFGPIADLDGNAATNNPDVSADYKLLPTHLSITFDLLGEPVTREMYILLSD